MIRLQFKTANLYSKSVDPHTECGAVSFPYGSGARTVNQTVTNNCYECYSRDAEPHRVITAPVLVLLIYMAPAPVFYSELP
jgi:hypothetical protein